MCSRLHPEELIQDIPRFTELLMYWFQYNGRNYPWRNTTNPYHILTAEFMLQRTTPSHVVPVYKEFLKHYATIEAACTVSTEDFIQVLRPLGLVHRAVSFKKALTQICKEHAGIIPDDPDELECLPGIGPYTARAVVCFAYGRDLALLDVNTIRVICRCLNIRSQKRRPHTDRLLWTMADCIVPKGQARQFNLGLIDLSALICQRRPKCAMCPMLGVCISVRERGGSSI